MRQIHLPLFPVGSTQITSSLSFTHEGGRITYFYGSLPVFFHDATDLPTFKMITAQFCVSGHASQAEISRAFGVTLLSMKRAVKRFRAGGPAAFYAPRATRGAAVLTASVLEAAQRGLDEETPVSEVAISLGIKPDTLAKAINAGKLRKPASKKKTPRT